MCDTVSSQDKGALNGWGIMSTLHMEVTWVWALDYCIKEEWVSRDCHWIDVTEEKFRAW